MLRLSRKADYAVFLLGCITRQGAYPGGSHPDAVVSAQEISTQAGLNKSVVANLLKDFARHGLLESVRGLKGGYRLARAPELVTLSEIVGIVEGPFHLVDCLKQERPRGDGPTCGLIDFCPSKNPMRVVHERIAELFTRIRLDELCGLRSQPARPAVSVQP